MTDKIEAALKEAYRLGQVFMQEADSESYAQNRRAFETRARFDALVSETVAQQPATVAQPNADKFIATFRCESNGVVFSTDAPIHSVSMHDDGVVEVVIDHWPEQPASVGEEIMVNTAHDVYTLPLQPSGLDGSSPRFVVHVPGPEQHDVLIDAESVQAGEVHPDDAAVDAFAAAMKEKLAAARAKGRGGWNSNELGMQQRLSDMLHAHVEKGDPRDVANFCMFLHQRGESILPQLKGRPAAVDRPELVAVALAVCDAVDDLIEKWYATRESGCLPNQVVRARGASKLLRLMLQEGTQRQEPPHDRHD